MLNQHEKFFAFLVIIVSITVIALALIMRTLYAPLPEAVVSMFNQVFAGLLTVLGGAATLLFRTDATAGALANAVNTMANNAPPAAGSAALSPATHPPAEPFTATITPDPASPPRAAEPVTPETERKDPTP